jgi:hypothetical protein
MLARSRLVLSSVAPALLLALSCPGAALAAPAAPATPAAAHTVVAYYLHGAQRCRTCLHIQGSAEKVVRASFAEDVAAGRLAWRTADYDKPENEHFVKDFQLVSSSLVLVELDGDTVVRFKVLDKTWQYARDQAEFEAYVERETAAFLKAAQPAPPAAATGKAPRG